MSPSIETDRKELLALARPLFQGLGMSAIEDPVEAYASSERTIRDAIEKYGVGIKGLTEETLSAETNRPEDWTALTDLMDTQHGVSTPRNITDGSGRTGMIASFIQVSTKLLWLNAGGLNRQVYRGTDGQRLADQFQETFSRRPETPVIMTFHCEDEDLGPFVKAVSKHPKSLVLRLARRMENHFILAVRSLMGTPNVSLLFEAVHNEDQDVRLALSPSCLESKRLEVAIVMRHLLADGTKFVPLPE